MRTPRQAEAAGYTAREIMAVLRPPGAAAGRSVLCLFSKIWLSAASPMQLMAVVPICNE
jgi:hypothetical protein